MSAIMEARHRVEGFIRRAKATGLARWPSANFAMNTAWVTAVQLACDLLCWTRPLLLDGSLAVAEPHTLRYRLLHTGDHTQTRPKSNPPNTRNLALGKRTRRRVLATP